MIKSRTLMNDGGGTAIIFYTLDIRSELNETLKCKRNYYYYKS
jgi:hypothetical protein